MIRRNKFNARAVVVDGERFDSLGEARRYGELKLLERTGAITGLALHPKFECRVNGRKICTYIADFRYREDGRDVIEDFKSGPTRTPVYRLKKKLVEALHGVEIREVP